MTLIGILKLRRTLARVCEFAKEAHLLLARVNVMLSVRSRA